MKSMITDSQKERKIFKDYLESNDLEKILSEMANSVVHSQDPNPIVYMIKYLTGLLTEEERIKFNINIDPPYPTGVPIVSFPEYQSKNILSKYLVKNNWSKYKYTKTAYNNNINNMTRLSDKSKTDKIGLAIVDKDCINAYKDLLEKVIYEIHNIDNDLRSEDVLIDLGISPLFFRNKIFFYEKLKENVKQVKIIFYRNIEGYSYNNIDKRNGKLKEEIEKEIFILKSEGFLPNNLKKIENDKLEEFISNDIIISKEYKWMSAAGFIHKNYSLKQRGIFANDDLSFIILINFSNHLEIIITLNTEDEKKVQDQYNFVMEFMQRARLRFSFDIHPKFGYITSNVSLIGAGYEVVVFFKHKNIKKRKDIFKGNDLNYCDIDVKENQVVFSNHFHLCDDDLISFNKQVMVKSYGYKILCDNFDKRIDTIKIKLNKEISLFSRVYDELFPNFINTTDLSGENINRIINYFKDTENEDDLLFSSTFSYLVFRDFIYKYIYYRDKINLKIHNYMEKEEKIRDLVNIESPDYIDSLLNIKIYISRNIFDFPFPICDEYTRYNSKALTIIKNVLNSFNRQIKFGKFMSISEAEPIIKENGIQLFHNKHMEKYGLDPDYPKNVGFIKFEKPYFFATINDLNNINFILAINNPDEKVNIHNKMVHLLNIVNVFGSEIKFAYSKKFGFLTACPKYFGNGIKMSADIKIKKLKNENIINFIKDKNMIFEEVKEKGKKDYRVIRLLNKGSFCYSETEMLSEWLGTIYDIIIEDKSI